ncbi:MULTISPECIES: CdaR family transcriptional regulator [unclassified Pseudofrankia]|uniref:PucR family transcriptional regulator n=1 Tax=unclassified Pseudofrankia TaxID=2994372 RepID=UPI0008D943B1|nr:transcriptional regulator [Pseudofrankia sp. BMG5.36]
MVQTARMKPSWPVPSDRVRELMRRGAERVLSPAPEVLAQLNAASLSGLGTRTVAADPALAEATARANAANLRQWAAWNVQRPAERVPPYLGPEAMELARDLVRRGLDRSALDSYRTSQSAAWRLWMDICFELTADREELQALLDISALSISTFVDDTVEAVSARVEAERDELTRGSHAERMATVTLLLEGAPLARGHAESQLGYGLAGPQTAAIVWATAPGDGQALGSDVSADLEAAAEALMRAGAATRRLTVVASVASLWVWLPVAEIPQDAQLESRLRTLHDIRIAIGRGGRDLDGFRRSHLDAATTQRMLTRITARQPVTRFQDVQLVALMTVDPALADEFVGDALGPLASADAEIRHTVSTYVREQFNASRAARRLYTHRNTVLRRLAHADQLLPRPLAENPLDVAAALEIVRLRATETK